ncbi:MAG TPA: hypothetical protein VH277_15095 [Gemmatimonadaceae bacterium]|jgi:hypothetical protein|nr:hypothetical protein [Gemmatimonadaceae bacterium]
MSASTLQPATDASFRGAMRLLARVLPAAALASGSEAPLETQARTTEPARTISTIVIEGGAMRAHRVFGEPLAGVAAFLDGTQVSRTIHSTDDGVPVIHGTVAAVIRERRNRRLYTWRHVVRHQMYAPRHRLPPTIRDAFDASGLTLRDVTVTEDGSPVGDHPLAWRDAAVHLLQKDREAAEQELAAEWCGREARTLLIDGGISGSERIARAGCAVGVIKSHRTLYAEGEALVRVFALGKGERSSVFRVTSPKRATVASWYLRMRDRKGIDPMWGLVRIEVAHPERVDEAAIGTRADLVSRWVMAEAAPTALPDGRWDKMVYGIRDCEEFLRAIV